MIMSASSISVGYTSERRHLVSEKLRIRLDLCRGTIDNAPQPPKLAVIVGAVRQVKKDIGLRS